MLEILKQLHTLLKEEREIKKYKATLAKLPICYEALEQLLKRAEVKHVIFEVQQPDGTIIRIKPEEPTEYKSFKQKFAERNMD